MGFYKAVTKKDYITIARWLSELRVRLRQREEPNTILRGMIGTIVADLHADNPAFNAGKFRAAIMDELVQRPAKGAKVKSTMQPFIVDEEEATFLPMFLQKRSFLLSGTIKKKEKSHE